MRGLRRSGPRAIAALGLTAIAGALGSLAGAGAAGCGDEGQRRGAPDASSPGDGPARGDGGHGDAGDTGPALCPIVRGSKLKLQRITRIPGSAVLVTSPPGDPRLFVVGQNGQIWIYDRGGLRAEPFLDLSLEAGGPVVSGAERGLLGLAFHPRYAENGRFFVYYTTEVAGADGGTQAYDVVARYEARPEDRFRADAGSGRVLLSIADPFATHNGGMMEFGEDGLLYIGNGDGGDANDPFNHAQDRGSLLGKMLRLDVDRESGGQRYAIPAGNPFGDEIFMLGLRNPWRWSFDEGGDLYLTDVGQSQREEIQIIPAGTGAGRNLGWKIFEGELCTSGETGSPSCDATGMTFPQLTKDHAADGFCSIIGGDVYRGRCYPDLVGRFFYSDYCTGGVRSLRYEAGAVRDDKLELGRAMPQAPSSIHAASDGELYLTTILGIVYHLEATE